MSEAEHHIDWSLTTWEGSRREQLRRWRKLTLRQKLEALEEMDELAERFRTQRQQRGLPVVGRDV